MSHLVLKEFILRGFKLYFFCYQFLARSSLADLEEKTFDTGVLPNVLFGQETKIKPRKHVSISQVIRASLHLLFYFVEEGNRLKVKVTTQEFLGRPIKLQNKDHVQYKLKELIKGSTHLNSLIK